MPGEWPAERLAVAALHWLRHRHPRALLLCELGLGAWSGGGRLDVAAITDERIIGIEIKGDGDSPARLSLQGIQYALAASEMWLLPAPSIYGRCDRARHWRWGLLEVAGADCLEVRDDPTREPLSNSPHVLWDMLWAPERRALHRRLCHERALVSTFQEPAVPEQVPLAVLRPAVVQALRSRDWLRGGNYPKREVWRPEDELPPLGQQATP